MNKYYVAFQKSFPKGTQVTLVLSWLTMETDIDLDTMEGIEKLIETLEKEYECDIWIVNWKLLK